MRAPGAGPGADGLVVPDAEVASYYGRPVLKEPVWRWPVPAYLFAGGLAGASASLALVARLAGDDRLARTALGTAAAAALACPPLLIEDLGRKARFANMLRVAKPTSPMSVGTWVLVAFVPSVTVAAASELLGVVPLAGRAAEVVAGVLGPVMATYTAVLVSDTAIPVWHEGRRELPFVFAASAAAGAAAMVTLRAAVGDAAAGRRLLVLATAVETAAMRIMRRAHGDAMSPYEGGGPAALLARWAEALSIAGCVLATVGGRRRRGPAVAGALLTLGGGMAQRVAVFRAGFESARDPRATVGPQRLRTGGG